MTTTRTRRVEAGGIDSRLDHVGLNVPDLDQAVAFFQTWLGAEVCFRMERFVDPSGVAPTRLGAPHGAGFALAMLRIGEARLELLQWWTPDGVAAGIPLAPAHAPGAAHVGIAVESMDDALERLREAPGVRVLGEPVTFAEGPTPGLTNAFVLTPWGALLELLSWPAP